MPRAAREGERLESEDTLKIRLQADAQVQKLRAWQHFVVATIAVGGSVVLSAMRIMPIEVASNVLTAIVLVLVLGKRNGAQL